MPNSPQNWRLDSYFPEFDGGEYRDFKVRLNRDLGIQLETAAATPPLGAGDPGAWARMFASWEGLSARLAHLGSYLSCLAAADAANEAYQAESAGLSEMDARAQKLRIELLRAFREARADDWESLLAQPGLEGAGHTLEHLRREAGNQMSRSEEALAADLAVDGFHSWGRLYDTVTGKMDFLMSWPGGRSERIPMAQNRALMSGPDPEVRRAAFAGGNRVWQASGDMLAAALNSIAGTRLTLCARRGIPSFLGPPFEHNSVSKETVETMFGVIAGSRELPRRILRLGARLQGIPALGWSDLEAPRIADDRAVLGWDDALRLVGQAFGTLYPALGEFTARMISLGWIESEKRPNKRPGGFCTGSVLTGEQRIFMTFNGTMHDVNTLAHEIGHAWHSHLLGGLRPCAQAYPMTLAETASTFAELLMSHGLLADPSLAPGRRLYLLDQSTNHAPAYLLNIPVRFEFERRFYEERRAGVVPVSRLCELMIETQREIYGDALAPGAEDPWFWASKLHFFFTDASFYNFPYTFGFLLSQALFGEFLRTGTDFLPRYEEFLRLTGSSTCEEVVRRSLGRDIRDPHFWREALDGLEARVRDFEAAADVARAP